MDPPWLQTPLPGTKRKSTDSSPSSSRKKHNNGDGPQSKKTKLNDGDGSDDGAASPEVNMTNKLDLDEREREAIMLADGFEKAMSRDEKRKMKKESAKAAQKAVSRGPFPFTMAGGSADTIRYDML
jgi:hypothetical protein